MVRFELTKQTRQSLDEYIRVSGKKPGDFLFGGRPSRKPRKFERAVTREGKAHCSRKESPKREASALVSWPFRPAEMTWYSRLPTGKMYAKWWMSLSLWSPINFTPELFAKVTRRCVRTVICSAME